MKRYSVAKMSKEYRRKYQLDAYNKSIAQGIKRRSYPDGMFDPRADNVGISAGYNTANSMNGNSAKNTRAVKMETSWNPSCRVNKGRKNASH